MIYCVNPESDEPIMLINKHVGMDDDFIDDKGVLIKGLGMGVDGSLFQEELLFLDQMNKKRIQVWINSVGGVVMDGYNIYSAIMKSKTPVDTYAVGGVASIAAVIFQAGRKRYMQDYAWLMYHNPFGGSKNVLDTMKQSLTTMIAERCKMSLDDVSKMMDRTSYIGSAEAKNLNLCDAVLSSSQENTKYLRQISDPSNFVRECNLVLNTLIDNNINSNHKKSESMDGIEKVNMRLKLNSSARPEDTIAAIDAIENKLSKAESQISNMMREHAELVQNKESELDKLKAKIKQLEEDKLKNEQELEDCNQKLKAMEADKKKAEDAEKEEKAKNMVDDYVKKGAIKNEETVKLKWINLAKNNMQETEEMLKAIPINKVANVIPQENPIDSEANKTTAAALAAKARLKRLGKL